jgi:hypothetical protein
LRCRGGVSIAASHQHSNDQGSLWRIFINTRSTTALLSFILLWLIGSTPSIAAAPAADQPFIDITPIQRALAKLDANNLDEYWHVTMDVEQDGEQLVIQTDPLARKYEKRRLISVEGKTPEKNRLKEFREAEEKRIDEEDADAKGFDYLVDLSTLAVAERSTENIDEDSTAFFFLPKVKALEKSRDNLHGTLILNHATETIEKIEITNIKELSPAFSVTVQSYRLTLWFQPEQGEQLLHKMESHAVGKAGFFKSFESMVSIAFRDFRRVQKHVIGDASVDQNNEASASH